VRVVYEKARASQSSATSRSTRALTMASSAAEMTSISSKSLVNACTLSLIPFSDSPATLPLSLGLGGLRLYLPLPSFPFAEPFL
jgi:hypothetical protein